MDPRAHADLRGKRPSMSGKIHRRPHPSASPRDSFDASCPFPAVEYDAAVAETLPEQARFSHLLTVQPTGQTVGRQGIPSARGGNPERICSTEVSTFKMRLRRLAHTPTFQNPQLQRQFGGIWRIWSLPMDGLTMTTSRRRCRVTRSGPAGELVNRHLRLARLPRPSGRTAPGRRRI